MKLYNEEQVIKAIELARTDDVYYPTNDEIVNSLTPIELPSNEEIDKIAPSSGIALTSNAFKLGAKWMRDKIQGGNK